MKHIGFTGTGQGMTQAQTTRLTLVMRSFGDPSELVGHHGDDLGADAGFDRKARWLGWGVIVHPPLNERRRAFCRSDEHRDAEEYLVRNGVIVEQTVGLLATPAGFEEELRSGTWATIRCARRLGRPRVIIWPDGSVTRERC